MQGTSEEHLCPLSAWIQMMFQAKVSPKCLAPEQLPLKHKNINKLKIIVTYLKY